MNRQEQRALRQLANLLAGLSEPRDVRDFMTALLTPRERERLALRWRLVCLLETGMSQRAVARRLGISLCKITRGSRELKHGPPRFRAIVDASMQALRRKGKPFKRRPAH